MMIYTDEMQNCLGMLCVIVGGYFCAWDVYVEFAVKFVKLAVCFLHVGARYAHNKAILSLGVGAFALDAGGGVYQFVGAWFLYDRAA